MLYDWLLVLILVEEDGSRAMVELGYHTEAECRRALAAEIYVNEDGRWGKYRGLVGHCERQPHPGDLKLRAEKARELERAIANGR